MLKVMIIDDCEKIGYSLSELFDIKGHKASYMCNAQKALEFAQSTEADEYDYILIDLYLNGVTGVDVFQALAQRELGCKAVFVSGCNPQNDIFQKAIACKIPIVVKKFNSLELIDNLEKGTIVEWTRKNLADKGIEALY